MNSPGLKYAKAGVMLMDLQPATSHQLMLDFDETMPKNRVSLMDAMDLLNQRFGRASCGRCDKSGCRRH